MHERRWRPDWPCPVAAILGQHRRGGADPTYRVVDGVHWRGIRTPTGPATLAVSPWASGEVRARAWGTGADWALESLPALLGAEDDWSRFEPHHPVLADARRAHPHVRLSRSGLIWESLFPAILEQKVTGKEAFAGFRRLVLGFGEPAPGPGADVKLWLQPAPRDIAAIASWEWLKAHVDPARSRTAVLSARVATSLERLSAVDSTTADQRLQSLRGIGVWTSAEVRQRALGDPDAVSFGDYHVAKNIGWALAGRAFDDTELEDFLEPWRGQRGRVQLLVAAAGLTRPRRGPRMSLPTHYPRPVP